MRGRGCWQAPHSGLDAGAEESHAWAGRAKRSPVAWGTVEVRVVGGGALGLSAALALVERGHDVTVQDRGPLGGEATGKAAGIVSTMTWSDEEYKLIAETRGAIGELISLAMIEGDASARHVWKPVESITVARGDKLAILDDMQARLERNTEEPERMGAAQAAREFPEVRFEPGEEILVAQEDGVVEAGDLVQVLRGRLDNEGVTFETAPWVAPVASDAQATVLATGAWTPGILRALGSPLPLIPYRTQLAAIQMPGDVPIVHDTVHGFYVRPESDTGVLAGNGTELRGFDPDDYDQAASPGFRDSIAERVVRRLRDGGDAAWRQGWAGLCVATPDKRPVCGAVPGHDNLFVLSGDNGFGVMRSLALGERLADAVDGRGNDLDPGRFPADMEFTPAEGFNF